MDAIRPDHDVGRVGRPVGEAHHGLSGILTESRTAVSGTHRARRQLLREQGEQIGAVNADVSSRAGELMGLVVGGPPSDSLSWVATCRAPSRATASPTPSRSSIRSPFGASDTPAPTSANALPARTPARRFRPASAQPPLRSRRARHRSRPPAAPRPSPFPNGPHPRSRLTPRPSTWRFGRRGGVKCHDLHRSGGRAVFTMRTYAAASPSYGPELVRKRPGGAGTPGSPGQLPGVIRVSRGAPEMTLGADVSLLRGVRRAGL